MINQELFNTIISEVINFNEKVDNWEELVGPGIFETSMVQSSWKIIDFLILTNFNEEGQDWINWWLYEKSENPELKALDAEDKEIPTETIDDLWNLVKDYRI